MKTQKQLEQGCGKKLHYSIKFGGNILCGNRIDAKRYLCDKCKSLLSQKIEDKKKVLEIIDKIVYNENKWLSRVTINGIEQSPDILLSKENLSNELKSEVEKI